MSALALDMTGAKVLLPGQGLVPARLSFAEGRIVEERGGRAVDLSGCLILPGIVDLHGDGFERHVAPRRGAMTDLEEGIAAAAAELAAHGITTAVMAQFHSWEGGLRGPEFAARVMPAIAAARARVVPDLIPQLRFETHLLDAYADLPAQLAAWQVPYVVFNDHLPHSRLAEGRRPKQLTGQALKAGRNPDRHFELLLDLHARGGDVPAALDALCARLAAQGLRMGSHDDQTAEDRAAWRARGVRIAEFPETRAAAEAARAGGDAIILGAPNVVRGGSHKGNVSALDLVTEGLCDALASDYHYPSPRRAALRLAQTGVLSFEAAWDLVSTGPARVLGLADRGTLTTGKRADFLVLEEQTQRVVAVFSGGQVAYMAGEMAARFLV
ncbi:alpha-D-ribose 1-methylphosphonate 5-triphosphate diphosphatase [Antarcticimicrobium sediminis]|uniref:Alpha-D-ribose 1-methylphosphonate 5-triphosphate diphosphatase n=1 Tax=Antarcticimicrobium sediminis TaxID=2546227 RepID=A0A4R5EQ53_9RHOB|nr:alpha-D-ribose 1-methylphosphonate 5-triphosphate diphosphatase [Antarcticimicrobium sediminis]TDE36650.1 alpha-D-ribose 1-methylphosphonate 5-triphosphate diphosphatase [Antarcticimicrobium sediminis]